MVRAPRLESFPQRREEIRSPVLKRPVARTAGSTIATALLFTKIASRQHGETADEKVNHDCNSLALHFSRTARADWPCPAAGPGGRGVAPSADALVQRTGVCPDRGRHHRRRQQP